MKDKSADERLVLGREIYAKENQIDEVNQEYRNHQAQLERFHNEMNRLFYVEEELYVQEKQEGEQNNWKSSEFQGFVKKYSKLFLMNLI
ncbi:hypothetical protein [Lactococcus protaetiae]|uniref:Uncharacterized protein n=1 Tax=Lactococcus protaetiae TaxID=2592653 RepID=A0A514Z742_9LACT|nr:hypothetical protein [Lactococcus protaetiae]QDK70396.1 hypothetical protein FLP15_03435 [Lactococcus protaetiae]